MKFKFRVIICTGIMIMSNLSLQAQITDDPDRNKIIPDKVFEIGIPMMLIFLIINAIISIFKIRGEARLKEKALEKGISESTLIELFRDDKTMIRNNYLKWFLVLAALGTSLIYIHLLDQYVRMKSGYLALGLIALFISIAFLIYYLIIRKKS